MGQENKDSFTEFEREVLKGLTAPEKFLSSKFLYDEAGDRIFQKIMDLPQYYLTRCELEIIKENAAAIAENFNGLKGLDLFELGSGDGKKTKFILRELLGRKEDYSYYPIDISLHALEDLRYSLRSEFPDLEVIPFQDTYSQVLDRIGSFTKRKKVILMLGSNIGNLSHPEAIGFLKKIRKLMTEGDMLMIGFDLKKDPEIILAAYNDPGGITESFNKNLLLRINRELGANFKTDNFIHWPVYDPETGMAKSFLLSKVPQQVRIPSVDLVVDFSCWETIHMEISQKYDDKVIRGMAGESGLKIFTSYTDKKQYYRNYIFVCTHS